MRGVKGRCERFDWFQKSLGAVGGINGGGKAEDCGARGEGGWMTFERFEG